MKLVFVLVLALLVASIGCGQSSRDAERDKRIDELNRRVAALEEQANNAQAADQERQTNLAACLEEADDTYSKHMQGNASVMRQTTYSVPIPVVETALKEKSQAIEECHLLFGKK